MRILVLGSGGREHALCWKIQQSPFVTALYCAPGNAGIAQVAECVAIDDVMVWAKEKQIDLVVVGPEAPLVEGLADRLNAAGIDCFGCSQAAAQLEGSKAFAKAVMDAAKVPTAAYAEFDDAEAAKAYIRQQGAPIVVKADGLAAGKGVIVAETLDQALEGVDSLQEFGSRLIVEEFLTGPELSFFALCDGETALGLTSAQDHKRVGDGDTGPNTGGMGAFSPTPHSTADLHAEIMQTVVQPTLDHMKSAGMPFVGVLFVGLMLTPKGLRVLEYNIRFGDPECQVLMQRMKSDLVPLLAAASKGELQGQNVEWHQESALTVVMASKGYPGVYDKGTPISSLPMDQDDLTVFHAGTGNSAEGQLVANGGRVLNITAKGIDTKAAQKRAYDAIKDVNWPNGFYRSDIGWQAV